MADELDGVRPGEDPASAAEPAAPEQAVDQPGTEAAAAPDAPAVPDDPRAAGAPSDQNALRTVAEIKRPSTLGGVIYLLVLAGALTGVVVAATGAWRTGVSWLAMSMLAAAGARLALHDDNAGMLRVRRKALDALVLTVLAVVLLVLVASIPDQP